MQINTIYVIEWADRHLRAIRMALAPLFVLMVALVYAIVYLTGGIKFVYSHSMYLPIMLAGIVFGLRGGLAIGLLGGFTLGPLMPIDVTTGEMQNTANWLYRTAFFSMVGLLSGFASDRARAYIEHLKWVSRHDQSTHLPNRSALFDRLTELAETRQHQPHLLVVVAVENMMELKAALGFSVIRETIRQLADRFLELDQGRSDVYRTETTHLCLLLPVEEVQSEELLTTLVQLSREPILLNNIPIHIDSRMGSVSFAAVDEEPYVYLQRAEAALTVAEKSALDYADYHPDIIRSTEENLAVLGSLQKAIEGNQLSLDYQPKVTLATGLIYGAEALLRWNHPTLGPLPPEAFIPRIEQSTLIQVVTDFSLEQAAKQVSSWQRAGLELPVAVNISTRNLLHPGFADQLAAMLERYTIDGTLLELEITEGALMTDMERTIEELNRMTQLQIIISIDDFGTGYSSLQYLHRLPISLIKIDQSFVRRCPADKGAVSIVEAAVTLAHNMGIKALAEGVENATVYHFLRDIGCDLAQGYLVSRPLSADEFFNWYHSLDGTFRPPLPAMTGY
ncbi:putative bifunctional diguanylate cyclase/phosphodiesterase [Desulfofustis limnaeus]|uniref:Sensor domain-containing phosphodiesterase n=1 Tax=Desulfofustis limnaeus TaxID=2740163 RepID=A0ABN6M5E9_9BACT|nr:bifunctional diguanylate cyclase/phosphodiesterase [Desulfofustis limnaeus]MDX9895266.1 bifunctional diguanylate cyclase/phosphodiesterase [Desulfofustis sp.]BDD86519.1 sensor domain-containing phosphodiesterase [Desulfofustis limnaeus]